MPPLSVISIVPVPVLRLTKNDVLNAAEAIVTVWNIVPLPALAVSVEAELATPSIPVASFAVVTFVATHAALVKSLF